jgi:SAM-dependent methyltransferase
VPDEVTSADIARLAGVGRAAVSNWRRRHGDFPQPVGGPPTSPTFALPEVEAWLQANGKQIDESGTTTREPAGDDAANDLALIVASLLPPGPVEVLDPACGAGLMLAAAARRLGPSSRYLGQDLDRSTVERASLALADAGVGAISVELLLGSPLAGDALIRRRGTADVVVSLPPARLALSPDELSVDLPWEFGAPSQVDPYLAWLQVCYAYVRPGGLVLVAMPAAAAVRAAGRRVRAELLRSGALHEVVALPDSLGVAGPWQIWALSRPTDRPTYRVRLVDLSVVDAADLPRDDDGWERVYCDFAMTRDVDAIELLDEDVLLVPARHVEPPVRDVGPDYDRARADLARAAAAVDARLPALASRRSGSPAPSSAPLVPVMDLVRVGAVAFVDKGSDLRRGDVVLPAGPDRVDAWVVEADGPRLPGDVLRCDPDVIDPYFLACFLRSEVNRRRASGTQGGSFRLDLRRARVPRLPVADQRRYGEAFRQLVAVTDSIDRLRSRAREALDLAVYGLTAGVLAPGARSTSKAP